MRAGWRSALKIFLNVAAGAAVALFIGIAFDYGIGPVQAAPAQLPVAVQAAPSAAPATASPAGPESIGPDPGMGFVRLPGHVLDVLPQATRVDSTGTPPSSKTARKKSALTLTVVLKRDDPMGFDRYLDDVYDTHSKNFRRFLTQRQLTQRFGPSKQAYAQVLDYLRGQGLRLVQGSKNRMTLTVRGERSRVEQAFRLNIDDYSLGDASFAANAWDPAVPASLRSHVLAIGGLSTLAQPRPAVAKIVCGPTPITTGPDGILTVNIPGDPKTPSEIACRVRVTAVFGLIPVLGCLLGIVAATYVAAFVPIPGAPLAAAVTGGEICALKDILVYSNQIYTGVGSSGSGIHPPVPPGANVKAAPGAGPPRAVTNGSGQKVGLLEFDGFNSGDVGNYLALIGAPASQMSNLSVVPVGGGIASPGNDESEVLLDIDTIMTLAPAAKVAVYEAPFSGHASSFTTLFNAMINDGVTVISNSWASCEDQVSQAEAQSVDAVLQSAAASGISVFNGSGDTGSTCLDGSANTVSVPADSPSATAVGGTSLPLGFASGLTYGSETWWNGSSDVPATGQGGLGVSKYFTKPAYQNASSTAAMRSVPDVVIRADPANGVLICQADNGGCPSDSQTGGTSLAAPEWAALAALLNQAQGKKLGAFNPLLYPLAATDAFHNAGSMGSDFAHVGLGSPNLNALNRLLKGQSVGLPNAAMSEVLALAQPASVMVASGGAMSIPADGTSPGGVKVTLFDANGNTVSGKTVTLTANSPHAIIAPASGVSSVSNGAVVFTVTDSTAETLTFTATDTTDGIVLSPVTLVYGVPPAAGGGISANPPTVAADGQTAATIIVTLQDSLSRPVPGKVVSISDGGAHAVITGPSSGVTDANGQIQFAATDQVDETVTFAAVDVTDSNIAVPGTAVVTYSGSVGTACGVGVVPTAGSGYAVTPFITGLPAAASIFYSGVNFGCPGANNPTFLPSGEVLASDFLNGSIYQTGLTGGAVVSANVIGTVAPTLSNITIGKDGSLYATQGGTGGEIVQLNSTTGAVLRTVASGLTCPAGLSIDPLSGDLFFDDECTGAGTDNASIFRVVDPAGTDPARPTAVVVYATLPHTANGGMAFAPNGTLYAVSGYFGNINAEVDQISATSAATVTVAPVTGITSDFAVAIGVANTDGSAQSLIVEPAGTLSEVPIAHPGMATVLAMGSPGVGVTGPDGCLYSAHYDTIYRLAGSAGTCSFAPTSPAPSITLTPAVVAPNPPQGSSLTLTATLRNVTPKAGVPIRFAVVGANTQAKSVLTDVNGNAALTYMAYTAGRDSVTATAPVSGGSANSNVTKVTWATGKHVTFLSLNQSPQGGTINQPVSVLASLFDTSVDPAVPISAQTVSLTLGGSTCTATTNSAGVATCSLAPSQVGTGTLAATFAGNSQLVASADAVGFNVSAGASPAPTVTIAVSPTTVAAGNDATLTWSSTNATTCAASGAWSGAEATSGTQAVTPAADGSYTYTLTCTGNGGTGVASAVLSASLAVIKVMAKSGGGAIGWFWSCVLGLLVLFRFRTALAGRGAIWGVIFALAMAASGSGAARADPAIPATDSDGLAEHLYMGVRVGSMPLKLDARKLDEGLAALGYGGVHASTDSAAAGGTVYVGYEFNPLAAVEFGYSHRQSNVATLSGTIPSAASITPLLQATAELLRGYGDAYALSWRGRWEPASRLTIDPRLGVFFWDTKVTAQAAGISGRRHA